MVDSRSVGQKRGDPQLSATPPPPSAYGEAAPMAAAPPPAAAYGAVAENDDLVAAIEAASKPGKPVGAGSTARDVSTQAPPANAYAAKDDAPKKREPLPRLQCKKCGIVYSGALPWDRKCLDCGQGLVEADPVAQKTESGKLKPVGPGESTATGSRPLTGTPLLWAPGSSRKPELIVTRYLIKDPGADLLGIGAKGVVYRAYDRRMGDRPVAVKLFFEGGQDATDAEGFRERRRVEREIRIQAALTHPAIVTAHDRFDTPHGSGIVLEFIDGESLEDRVRRTGALSVRDSARLTIEIARAVEFMHSRGIIHRDLKPSNVLLTRDGNVKVIDFGVAKYKETPLGLDQNPEAVTAPPTDLEGDQVLTRDGTIVGTPCYMSPEQAHGRIAFVDERSDIYGIGAILYFAVTARPPFSGDDVETILERVRKVPPPRPSKWNARVDPAIEAIVARAMMKVPEQRFSSAGQLAEQLRLYLDGEPLDPTLYREPIVKRLARTISENKTAGAVFLTTLAMVGVVLGGIELSTHQRKESDRQKRLQEAGRALGDMDPKAAQALYDEVLREDHDNEVAKNGYLSAVRAVVHVDAYREGKRRLEEARKARLATPDQAERLFDQALNRLEDAKRGGSPAPDLDALINEARGISHLDIEKPKAFAGDVTLRIARLNPPDLMEPLNRDLWMEVKFPIKAVPIEVGIYQAQIVPSSRTGPKLDPIMFPIRVIRGDDVAVEPIPAARPGMVYIRGKRAFRPGNPRHDDLGAVDVEPFSIDRREVQVAEYRQFLESIQDAVERQRYMPAHWPRGSGSCPDPDDYPITNVSFDAARAYAKFRGKDLPTEAQWQLAASGGVDDRDYPWGARFIATCTNCATGAPVRAGGTDRDRSPFGVLDMGGNVSEYVDGFFDTKGRVRLAKGGSYLRKAPVWERIPVEGPDRTIGFRCVRVEK